MRRLRPRGWAEATGADLGLAVFTVPHLDQDLSGAIGYLDLPRALKRAVQERGLRTELGPRPEGMTHAKQLFAAMPFASEFEDTFFFAMRQAAGAACERLDLQHYAGDITAKLKEMLAECDAVIADISGANANVLYEVGYAHALGKKTIHICSTPLDQMPFDVRQWNTIFYELGRTHALRDELTKHLKAVLGGT
jgi:nucleoside 2-deoxyribosyltransferase